MKQEKNNLPQICELKRSIEVTQLNTSQAVIVAESTICLVKPLNNSSFWVHFFSADTVFCVLANEHKHLFKRLEDL